MDGGNVWPSELPPSWTSLPLLKPEPVYGQNSEYPPATISSQVLMSNQAESEATFPVHSISYADVQEITPEPLPLGETSSQPGHSSLGSAVAASMGAYPLPYEPPQAEGAPTYGHELFFYNSQNTGAQDVQEITPEPLPLGETSSQPGFSELKSISSEGDKPHPVTDSGWMECYTGMPSTDHLNPLRGSHMPFFHQSHLSPSTLEMAQKKHRFYGRKPHLPTEIPSELPNVNEVELRNPFLPFGGYSGASTTTDPYQQTSHHLHPSSDSFNFPCPQRVIRTTKSSRDKRDRIEERLSKDEKKARDLNLPFDIEEIVNLPIEEFNEKLTKGDMTESQITLARDIRRRGKNKVAAQNCRKRKLDQINSLENEHLRKKQEKQAEIHANVQLKERRKLLSEMIQKLGQYLKEIGLKV